MTYKDIQRQSAYKDLIRDLDRSPGSGEARAADDDKARFDNCAIQVQNIPDAEMYIVIYPGTDRASVTRNTYERLSKRTVDYLVKNRGVD